MIKVTSTIVLLLVSLLAMTQEIERIKISGIITAPIGEDVESVSIYNISSQKGTVTNNVGAFELEVIENYSGVLEIFKMKGEEYVARLSEKE